MSRSYQRQASLLFGTIIFLSTAGVNFSHVAENTPTPSPYAFPVIASDNAGRLAQVATFGQGEIQLASWSPDGAVVAIGSDSGVWLYTLSSPDDQPHWLETKSRVTSLVYRPDGKYLAAGTLDGTLYLWPMADGASTEPSIIGLAGISPADSLVFSTDGHWLASGHFDGSIHLWPLETKDSPFILETTGSVTMLAFLPDGHTLLSHNGGSSNTLSLWDLPSAQRHLRVTLPWNCCSVALSPDGQLVAVADGDNLQLLDAGNLIPGSPLPGPCSSPYFSPDSQQIACAADNQLVLWNMTTRSRQGVVKGYRGNLLAVRFMAGKLQIVSLDSHGAVYVWDEATMQDRLLVQPVSYSLVASAGAILGDIAGTGTVGLWDIETHTLRTTYTGSSTGAAFSHDGRYLALAQPTQVVIFDTVDGKLYTTITSGYRNFSEAIFSADDTTLIDAGIPIFSPYYVLRRWNVATGQLKLIEPQGVNHIQTRGNWISGDGSRLFGAILDWKKQRATVIVWDTLDGKQISSFEVGNATVGTSVEIRANTAGTRIALWQGSGYGTTPEVSLWDVNRKQKLVTLTAAYPFISPPVFSPNGAVVAAAATDGRATSIIVWSVEGQLLANIPVTKHSYLDKLAFSADGTLLLFGGPIVQVWGVSQ